MEEFMLRTILLISFFISKSFASTEVKCHLACGYVLETRHYSKEKDPRIDALIDAAYTELKSIPISIVYKSEQALSELRRLCHLKGVAGINKAIGLKLNSKKPYRNNPNGTLVYLSDSILGEVVVYDPEKNKDFEYMGLTKVTEQDCFPIGNEEVEKISNKTRLFLREATPSKLEEKYTPHVKIE
jgi:hypothetical protein